MKELVNKWRELALQQRSEFGTAALEYCARELEAFIPQFEAAIRRDEAKWWEEYAGHELTYEGSCGVHMPSHCEVCQHLRALSAGNRTEAAR